MNVFPLIWLVEIIPDSYLIFFKMALRDNQMDRIRVSHVSYETLFLHQTSSNEESCFENVRLVTIFLLGNSFVTEMIMVMAMMSQNNVPDLQYCLKSGKHLWFKQVSVCELIFYPDTAHCKLLTKQAEPGFKSIVAPSWDVSLDDRPASSTDMK